VVVAEGQSLRCRQSSSKFRTQGTGSCGGDPATVLLSEIDAVDREPSLLEMMQAELAEDDEGEGGEGEDEESDGVPAALPSGPAGAGAEDRVVELWPFAFPVSYWSAVFREVGVGDMAPAVAILAPTAHPGSWLAARAQSSEVFIYTRRQGPHAVMHGRALGDSLRGAALGFAQEAPTAEADSKPWKSFESLAGVVMGEQVVEAYDVSSGGQWNDGLNIGVGGDAMAAAAAHLVAEQLEAGLVALTAVDVTSGRCLEARALFRDGESLPASALFWDEEAELESWMRQAGHERYRDRVVEVPGVLKDTAPRTVWAVLIGVAQFVNCFAGIRKGADREGYLRRREGVQRGRLADPNQHSQRGRRRQGLPHLW
jgi:hypothetical protein